jgi:predicted phage tail protein
MLTRRSMLIILALLLAPFVLAGCGNDKTTSPIIETPDTVAPATPAFVGARTDWSSVTLMWRGNTEADLAGYNVYEYNPDPGSQSSYTCVNPALLISTAQKVDRLTKGTTYYFRISAVDRSGNESAWSATIPVTIGAAGDGDKRDIGEY